MACTSEFIDFICDTLAPLGEVRFRKMMGDYVIYLNDKCVVTACDNIAFVKKTAMHCKFNGRCGNRLCLQRR